MMARLNCAWALPRSGAGRGAAADHARLDGIWGERDATAYPHVAERKRILQSIQPGARFTVVPGAGHWVQFEEADAFNRIITEYVG
jgi:pimeloyl-ACP methyl ester carboxylesterase